MENRLLQIHAKEADSVAWLAGLDADALRLLLVATLQTTLWSPAQIDKSLLRFYGHLIDGPGVTRFMQTLKLRLVCCDTYAWAVPDQQAIDTLCRHSPLIEVGAGRGYWAALAAAAGADIIAFDPHPPGTSGVNAWHRQSGVFHRVSKADHDVAALHPDRTLFLCWPPWNSDAALKALRAYKGRTVIYVGDEGHNAGSPAFYAELGNLFTRTEVVDIPRWPGANDRLEVWQRPEGAPSGA